MKTKMNKITIYASLKTIFFCIYYLFTIYFEWNKTCLKKILRNKVVCDSIENFTKIVFVIRSKTGAKTLFE